MVKCNIRLAVSIISIGFLVTTFFSMKEASCKMNKYGYSYNIIDGCHKH